MVVDGFFITGAVVCLLAALICIVAAVINQPPHYNKNLSAAALKYRQLTLFFLIVIAIGGIGAFFNLGQREDPDFTFRAMVVRTLWPGATTEQVDSSRIRPTVVGGRPCTRRSDAHHTFGTRGRAGGARVRRIVIP